MVPIVTLDALVMSWALQATLGVVLLIAFWAMTRVFEGPEVRAIAHGWTAFFVLMLASVGFGTVARLPDTHVLRLAVSALESVARVFMIFLWYPTASLLSGKPLPKRGWPVYVAVTVGAVAFAAIDLAVERLSPWTEAKVVDQLYPLMWAWLALSAFRLGRVADKNGPALRWLALGYGLYGIRIELVKALGHDDYATSSTARLLVVAAIQVAHVASFGVICLVVALALERARILRRADELRSAEARLMNARRLASLGELAARIAHDFNNALTVILGGVELSMTTLDQPGETASLLTDVAEAARKSRGLVAQLLAFGRPARSDHGGCDVGKFLVEQARSLARLAGPSATVVVDPPAGDAPVAVEPVMLERIVFNLITNARDATQGGGAIRVNVALETVARPRPSMGGQLAPGDYVRIVVEDTGGGIPPEVRDRIFEPFFTTKGSAGTGLGLATVYAIVTQARGDVFVTSEVGRGTKFEVFLPRAKAAVARAA